MAPLLSEKQKRHMDVCWDKSEEKHTLLSAGTLGLGGHANTDETVDGLKLLHGLGGVVDQGKASGLATTELGSQAENLDLVLLGLVHAAELLAELLLGDVGTAGVEDIPIEILVFPCMGKIKSSCPIGRFRRVEQKFTGDKNFVCALVIKKNRHQFDKDTVHFERLCHPHPSAPRVSKSDQKILPSNFLKKSSCLFVPWTAFGG